MKVKIGNIRGPQGPEGPEGPEGKQGPTGATGATGQVDASTPISFEENSSYVNIESGESIATIFGKCKKILGGILTGAGSTLLGADLTAGRVLLSNSSGKITASNITDTELGYLDGLTGNVQTSLNSLTENTLKYRGMISGDLNRASSNQIPSGIYFYQSGATISNAPSGANWGVFVQIGNSFYYFTQLIVDTATGVKTRKYSGNPASWSEWK